MSERAGRRPEPGYTLLDLYETALPQVYGYLLSRCGNRTLAEDLTAETFLAAVDSARREPAPAIGTPWLIGVARHKLVDHWRRREREERGLRVVSREGAEPENPWEVQLDAICARQVLAELGPHHQAVLTLLVRARAAFRRAYEGEAGLT